MAPLFRAAAILWGCQNILLTKLYNFAFGSNFLYGLVQKLLKNNRKSKMAPLYRAAAILLGCQNILLTKLYNFAFGTKFLYGIVQKIFIWIEANCQNGC